MMCSLAVLRQCSRSFDASIFRERCVLRRDAQEYSHATLRDWGKLVRHSIDRYLKWAARKVIPHEFLREQAD